MRKLIIHLVIILILPLHALCQSKGSGITPMHNFFKKYADSTIIIEYRESHTFKPSGYQILCKTDSFVNTFKYEPYDTTYYPIFKLKKSFPIQMWYMIGAKRSGFLGTPADINIFFNLVNIDPKTAKNIWQTISSLKPWEMVDDSVFGEECKDTVGRAFTDGDPTIIHLITKKEINSLIFNSPDYYEKLCPGNKNRQVAISIEKMFNVYFPKLKEPY